MSQYHMTVPTNRQSERTPVRGHLTTYIVCIRASKYSSVPALWIPYFVQRLVPRSDFSLTCPSYLQMFYLGLGFTNPVYLRVREQKVGKQIPASLAIYEFLFSFTYLTTSSVAPHLWLGSTFRLDYSSGLLAFK